MRDPCGLAGAFRNWGGNQTCHPVRTHEPGDERELAEVLRQAHACGETVKVVGAGHSWSDVACTDGHLVRLDRMRDLLRVERDACTVTVQAGMRLKELNELLADHALALTNLGSVSEQSVAGAISTGTHGTGLRFGCLSTQVAELRLMTASGDTLDLDASDGDTFEAARLGLGCLGVVTRITLRCEPAFDLEELRFPLPFDDALERMQALVDEYDHVKFWWLPHTDNVLVFAQRRVAPHPRSRLTRIARAPRAWFDTAINQGVFSRLLCVGARAPSLVPVLNRTVERAYFVRGHRVDRSDRVFNLAMPPVHREAEYGIPRDVAPLALRRLRELIDSLRIKVGFVVELRFVARDSILLSPAFKRDSCQLGAYIGDHPHQPIYFDAFQTLCRQLGGRPHWGKEFRADAAELALMFPAHARFNAVRRKLDPDGLFENRFVRRAFESSAA